MEGASNSLLLRRLGAFSLPGKSAPLSVYELMDFQKNQMENNFRLHETYAAALAAFEEQRWLESAELFKEILSAFPDDMPSQCLLFSCLEYYRNPPQQGESTIVKVREFAENRSHSNNSNSPGAI